MEIERQVIKLSEDIFESVGENTTECEAIIPDYFPEVYKVIRADAVPRLKSKRIENGRLFVDGSVDFCILYLPEDGKTLRSFSYVQPFSEAFSAPNLSADSYIQVRTKLEYIGCKLLNPRKAYLKAVVSIAVKAWASGEFEAVMYNGSEKTHMLKKDAMFFRIVAADEKSFKVSDDLDLYSGEVGSGFIVKNEASARFDDVKIISNKAIAKGTVNLHTLFNTGEGMLQTAEHSIAFSQVIDLDGMDETCECNIDLRITEIKAMLKDDITGSNCIMQVEVGCLAFAKAFKNEWVSLVKDAFDTEFEVDIESKPVTLERYIEKLKGGETVKDTVSGSDPIESVFDVSGTPGINGVAYNGNEITISGVTDAQLLGKSASGEIINLEKNIPFSYTATLSSPCEHIRCEPDVFLESISFVIANESSVDLNIKVSVEALVFASSAETVVSSIVKGEKKPEETGGLPVMTFYYAEKNESVWDIAKRFNTSPSAIRSSNKINDDDKVEEGKMLLLLRKSKARH